MNMYELWTLSMTAVVASAPTVRTSAHLPPFFFISMLKPSSPLALSRQVRRTEVLERALAVSLAGATRLDGPDGGVEPLP